MPEPQEQKKPWEKFAAPVSTAGPWNKYQGAGTKPPKEAAPTQAGTITPSAKPLEAPKQATQQTPQDATAQQLQSQIARWRPRWDTPEAILKDPDWYSRGAKYVGGALIGAGQAGATMAVGGAKLIHDIASALDPIEGYHRPLGEPQAQVGRDVVDMGKGIIDIGKATWDLVRHFPESAADPQKFGNTVANVAMVVDGGLKMAKALEGRFPKMEPGKAVTKAHELTSGVPSRILKGKAFEEAYRHSKGLDVAKKVSKSADAVHEEIKTHAEGIAKQIDSKVPAGTVSAADEAALIVKEFQDVVKTPEKAHPALAQMVKDARATAPKLWSWEKARQFRTSVGRAISKVDGPQKVVLTRVYIDLTKKLGSAAKQYSLSKSWEHYNELAMKLDKEFGDLIDDVRGAQSGREVGQILGKDVGLTTEFAKNLSKYGLSLKEVLSFVDLAKRVARNENFYQRSLFRVVYGSAPGFSTMVGLKVAGAPYSVAIGGGFLIGAVSQYLINLARDLRLSPDVIEHMMKERELPGKLRFDPGTFPPSGDKALPESTGGPAAPTSSGATSAKPAEGKFKGGINVRGVESSTAPRTRESDIQSHTSEIERLKKVISNPKATAEEKASAESQLRNHEELRRKKISEGGKGATKPSSKVMKPREEPATSPKSMTAPGERWYTDPGHIPGEPMEYLDVRSGDVASLEHAKAVIIERESPKGSKFEAVTDEGESLGTFDHPEQARKAAEKWRDELEKKVDASIDLLKQESQTAAEAQKIEEGKHGKGKLAEQAKARERISKSRAKAKRTREAIAAEAEARAQATHMDVSQLQIPEMEEFMRNKFPTAWRNLQAMRKAKAIPDSEYKEALMYYTLEALEGTSGE